MENCIRETHPIMRERGGERERGERGRGERGGEGERGRESRQGVCTVYKDVM